MQIFPAIDLRGGQCVRLRQGDYQQETVFDADPAAVARRWVAEGAEILHIVDLDGAREGKPINGPSIRAYRPSLSGVPCQLMETCCSERDIAEVLSWGIKRVVIGTKALQEPRWLEEMAGKFPEQDRARNRCQARPKLPLTAGWTSSSESALDLARKLQRLPLAALVYTDISRDGMLQGANVRAMADMCAATRLPVIASGGVTTLDDIRQLALLPLAGCIVGRALYENRLNLKEILAICAEMKNK